MRVRHFISMKISASTLYACSEYPRKWLQGCWAVTWLHGAAWYRSHLGTSSTYTTQPCTSFKCHLIRSHIRRMYVCLAVTCHLHFWHNDFDLLHAAAVTRGWNGYQKKSQRTKLTLEKKILPPPLPGLEPETFRSRVRRSTTELSPLVCLLRARDAMLWRTVN